MLLIADQMQLRFQCANVLLLHLPFAHDANAFLVMVHFELA